MVDWSTFLTQGASVYITSNANSFNERVFIVMKAATDYHKISSARTIYVWLSMSKKLTLKSHIGALTLATAFYAPDGQGSSALGDQNWTWDNVRACEEKISPSDVEKLEKYWELRDELKNGKKNLSNSRIESIISKKMNMSETETASLTYKEMKEFTVNDASKHRVSK